MKKIYISGKITGLPKEEYMRHFADVEEFLIEKGYSVINPAKVNAQLPSDTTYDQYMRMSFCMLDMVDAIYMLDNYIDSKGAMMELAYASNHNLEVMCEPRREG